MPHKTVEASPCEERPDRNLRAKYPYKMPVSRRGRERRQISAVPPELPAGDEESIRHAAKTVYRPQERIVKRILDDKNIDKRAALRILEILPRPDRRTLLQNPRQHQSVIFRFLRRVNPVFLPHFLPEDRNEPVIIRARHVDVRIVVPGDERVLPDGAEAGSAAELIGDPVAVADIGNVRENIKQHALELRKLLLCERDRFSAVNMFECVNRGK